MRQVDEDTEVILNDFLYWLRDEGWIKENLLDQAVDITVSDFVHR
jgi:hypothetical protein